MRPSIHRDRGRGCSRARNIASCDGSRRFGVVKGEGEADAFDRLLLYSVQFSGAVMPQSS